MLEFRLSVVKCYFLDFYTNFIQYIGNQVNNDELIYYSM